MPGKANGVVITRPAPAASRVPVAPEPSVARIAISDAEGGDAPSVLLIHGQPGSSLIWTKVVPLLRNRGVRVQAVDRPGYGEAGGTAIDQFGNATAIAQMLDEQSSPAVIVGHSLGAGIALALAATAPQHARAVVLIAPAAGPAAITLSDRLLAMPVIGPPLTWLGFRTVGWALRIPRLRRQILIDRVGLSAREADEVLRRLSRSDVWRSFVAEQRHLVTDAHRLHEHLGAIDCPVVIVAGSRDRVVRPRAVTAVARGLRESIITNTDTGHLIPIDDPESVVNAVLHALRWEYRNSLRTTASARATAGNPSTSAASRSRRSMQRRRSTSRR